MSGTTTRSDSPLTLGFQRAVELMSPNPVSLRQDASVREALALFTDEGFSAAPVIDEAGRPIGVVSRTDLLIHEREQAHHGYLDDQPLVAGNRQHPRRGLPREVEIVDPTLVREIMTPAVFTVPLRAPATEVVRRMLDLKVHQLFVVDESLALVGVISALDILRHLRPIGT